MTTAHRPTWKSAFGLADSINQGYIPTRSYSSRDLPGYLKLKETQWGKDKNNGADLQAKDFKAELLKREAEAKIKKNGGIQVVEAREQHKRLKNSNENQIDLVQDYEPSMRKKIKRPQTGNYSGIDGGDDLIDLGPNPFPQDQDSQSFIKDDVDEQHHKIIQNSQDDNDDSDQDDSELLREYEKIKQQRQKEQLFKREQKHEQSKKNREQQLLKGNPLVDSSYSLSKRWYQDTVFRNQAKKTEEKKSYVNDHVRSEFHRKFMHRFVGR